MDQQKIRMCRIWGTPGKWMNQGILRALAYEMGDIVHVDKVFEGVVDVDSSADEPAEERNRNRRIATNIREVVEETEPEVS